MVFAPRDNVPLAGFCTLGLGGPARFFHEALVEEELCEALAWAEAQGVPVFVLGGGSNLVAPDAGFPGLVLRVGLLGRTRLPADDGTGTEGAVLQVAAGEDWQEVVAFTVEQDLAGFECLSGIPGRTGATPIQNVGAYGQEVAEVIESVRLYDRQARQVNELPRSACAFAYRSSLFKRAPDRFVVLAVRFRLRPGGPPTLRYRELVDALGPSASSAGLSQVRQTVLALRRRKSMVIDPVDPNRRSVGSFFMNPIVDAATADGVVATALTAGLVTDAALVPRYPAGPGQVKLAAGWLIEKAGIKKGERHGPVGISSAHALALVHHGGGSTRALLALARTVRDRVQARFGVTLVPEPVILGADPADPLRVPG